MEFVFFILLFLSFYSYLLFPGILWIMSQVKIKPWIKSDRYLPKVSLIISAFNEERVIAEKIRNALELHYPKELLEIVVASDGSNDHTNEIVRSVHDERIKLYVFEKRIGKTACLNEVVPKAEGEIIVFTDANSMFHKDTLKRIMINFADSNIGAVTGWTKYISPKGEEDVTGSYARNEKWIKVQESRIFSCVGADGAIFSVRKKLYKKLDERDINDFIIPLDVVTQGLRVILDPEVYCYEKATDSIGKAYRRQVRITNRTLSAICRRYFFLNIFRYGTFSFFLMSHKVVRLLTPFFLGSAMTVNFFIAGIHPIYGITFAAMCLFILVGCSGLVFRLDGRVVSVSKLLLLTFCAQLVGTLRLLAGIEDRIWQPER